MNSIATFSKQLWLTTEAPYHLQIVLAQDVQGLGTKGTVTKAPYGYFRNYLLPMGLAMPLTDNYLACACCSAALLLSACASLRPRLQGRCILGLVGILDRRNMLVQAA